MARQNDAVEGSVPVALCNAKPYLPMLLGHIVENEQGQQCVHFTRRNFGRYILDDRPKDGIVRLSGSASR